MISSQRKAHRLIWSVLLVMLPVFLFLSISHLDFTIKDNGSNKHPIEVRSVGEQLHLELNEPFESASAVVFELVEDGTVGGVIGQLEGVGSYHFNTSKSAIGILIYDEIKKQEIVKITF